MNSFKKWDIFACPKTTSELESFFLNTAGSISIASAVNEAKKVLQKGEAVWLTGDDGIEIEVIIPGSREITLSDMPHYIREQFD